MGVGGPPGDAHLSLHHYFGTGAMTMSSPADTVEMITVEVTGMTCGSCDVSSGKSLDGVEGCRDAKVALADGRVLVTYERGAATPEQLLSAVIKAAYPAKIAAVSPKASSNGPKSCGCRATGNT